MLSGGGNAANPVDFSGRLQRLEWELQSMSSSAGPGRWGMSQGGMSQSDAREQDASRKYNDLMQAHMELHKAHRELLASHREVIAMKVAPQAPVAPPGGLQALQDEKAKGGRVGIIRLDGANYSAPKYSKKAVLGDAASKATWEKQGDKVFYQRAEGYTFTVCKYGFKDPHVPRPVFEKEGVIKIKGKMGDSNHMYIPNRRGGPKDQPRPRKPSRTEPWIEGGTQVGVQYIYDSETVMENLQQTIRDIVQDCRVDCITSACGFMANVQNLFSNLSPVPCLMSSLTLLPIVEMMAAKGSVILVLTANSQSFSENYTELIKPSWDIPRSRVELVGLQNVEGFGDEVAAGTTVDVDDAEENIVKEVAATIEKLKPMKVSCILSECTELPGYTNTLRDRFTMPVFDAITAANVLLNGLIPRDEYENDASYG